MKKVFLLLTLAIACMACEGPMGPMGPMGPSGSDGRNGYDGRDGQNGKDGEDGYGANWFSKTFTIQPHEWELLGEPDELNSYFIVEKNLPELTKDIYKERAVIAYIETAKGFKNGMPYVLHKGQAADTGEEFLWTETYDFDYSEGAVTFYLTYSDFNTHLTPSKPSTFHILLIW